MCRVDNASQKTWKGVEDGCMPWQDLRVQFMIDACFGKSFLPFRRSWSFEDLIGRVGESCWENYSCSKPIDEGLQPRCYSIMHRPQIARRSCGFRQFWCA